MGNIVLFINHRDKQCGVHQFGRRLYDALERSINYECHYIDPAQESEVDYWLDVLRPNIVVYNFYTGATMPWLSPQRIANSRHRFKQTCIFHEVPIEHMGFDLIFHQDPSFEGKPGYVNLARPIPRFSAPETATRSTERPIISSFGFGLGGKGFDQLATAVAVEFPDATLRINIPYAKFGDESGAGARSWAQHIHRHMPKHCHITHDFFTEPELLNWLSESTINCFFYEENYGRGISGTLDYALAVRRPIAITRSYQFQHVWKIDDSFVYTGSLQRIIDMGTGHLDKFHTIWGDAAVIAAFERGFDDL
jgi:hypothetical protein